MEKIEVAVGYVTKGTIYERFAPVGSIASVWIRIAGRKKWRQIVCLGREVGKCGQYSLPANVTPYESD